MKLTAQLFKIFSLIFLAQLIAVVAWSFYLFSNGRNDLPKSVVDSLTKVDKSILEGIILQSKIGTPLSRDLITYKLLELNNVDSATFLEPKIISELILEFELKDCKIESDINICLKQSNNIALSLIPLKIGNSLQGYLKLEKSLKSVEEINRKVLYTIGITVLAVFLINIFGLVTIWWKFLKPETSRLLKAFDNQKEDPLIRIEEYKLVQDKFLEAVTKIKSSEAARIALATELQKVNLSTQVAHDIRSPLEMLKGIKEDLALMPEDSRRRIQLGINRIEEITFNLLKANRQEKVTQDINVAQELLSLVLSVVTEKKIEYRNNEKIDIKEKLGPQSFGLFSSANRSTLKSILSNLINNAIESFDNNPGGVEISLEEINDLNVMKITDNGSGIPDSIAKNLFSKGFTTKKTGNGLGLFNAKQDIEAIGGTLTFETEVGKGTTFTITLPKSDIPPTFIDAIHAHKYERIIVLDDDPSFHDVWAKRLEGLESKIEHIFSVGEMFSKYQALHPKILLLSDFELMDKDYDGIDTIKKLKHAAHSVLVTARNEELEIQERCLKAGIKLLPKSLVNYVKVIKDLSESSQAQLKSASTVGETSGFTSSLLKSSKYVAENEARTPDAQDAQNQKTLIVLIDDDKLVRLNWSSHCKNKGIPFKAFVSIESFLDEADSIPKDAKIYIDSNLGDNIKGEIESEKIFNLGFKNLYLATGYGKEYIKKPDYIIEIFSKSPEVIE